MARVQLDAAVAALGAEHVAGEALRVHPHQDVRLPATSPYDQRHVLGAIHVVLVADDPELAELGRQPRLGDPVHQPLGAEPVGDELRDGDEGEVDAARAISCSSGRRAIEPSAFRISQMTPAGMQARQPREVHAGLGLPDALQHAARAGREAGRCDRAGAGRTGRWRGLMATWIVVARSLAEMPVVTPKRRSASMLTVKAVASSSVFRSVIWGRPSWSQRSPVSARQMSPRPCRVMKLISLGRDQLGRADEVALVLAVLVVGHDDDLAVAQVLDRLLDGAECHACLSRES